MPSTGEVDSDGSEKTGPLFGSVSTHGSCDALLTAAAATVPPPHGPLGVVCAPINCVVSSTDTIYRIELKIARSFNLI